MKFLKRTKPFVIPRKSHQETCSYGLETTQVQEIAMRKEQPDVAMEVMPVRASASPTPTSPSMVGGGSKWGVTAPVEQDMGDSSEDENVPLGEKFAPQLAEAKANREREESEKRDEAVAKALTRDLNKNPERGSTKVLQRFRRSREQGYKTPNKASNAFNNHEIYEDTKEGLASYDKWCKRSDKAGLKPEDDNIAFDAERSGNNDVTYSKSGPVQQFYPKDCVDMKQQRHRSAVPDIPKRKPPIRKR